MDLAARMDDYGRPAWLGAMVLGFIVFWPVGLGILAYLLWSGRMGCWKGGPARGRFKRENWWGQKEARSGGNNSSGNGAFDEYREETLRRLEEEQQEFFQFLERLRKAKDKAEFDQFMAERRSTGQNAGSGTGGGQNPGDGPIPQPQG
ncbi:DUF2852 domain-containing protein [Aquibaculum sediminis]|uniref:DUF2852 domain-containing protein n=1 Tax=Aquibaculum sediminis TaxID=3231907 RepID=UPI003452DB1B